MSEPNFKENGGKSRRAVCTVVSCNYWAYARVFASTLRRQHPAIDVFVLLVDRPSDPVCAEEELFTTVCVEELDNLPDPVHLFFKYNVLELNTAVKPYFFDYLFRRFGVETLIYCDPDVAFFAPLDKAWARLEEASCVLTPHITKPYGDRAWPGELQVNQAGIFNLGFIGLSRSPETARLLDWWKGKLYDGCFMDIASGMHVDQKWMNFVPLYFNRSEILKDPDYNIAYWNLHYTGAQLSFKEGRLMSGDRPAVFFHFSGFDYFDKEVISRHQNRFNFRDFPALRPLFEYYRRELSVAGHERFSALPYAFGRLDNGWPVSDLLRRLYRGFDTGGLAGNPFNTEDPHGFWRYAMEPCPASLGRRSVSRILDLVYSLRPDLRAVFPEPYGKDNEGLLDWARKNALAEYGHPLCPASETGRKEYSLRKFFRVKRRVYGLRISTFMDKFRRAAANPRLLRLRYLLRPAGQSGPHFGVNLFVFSSMADNGPRFLEGCLLKAGVPFRVITLDEDPRPAIDPYYAFHVIVVKDWEEWLRCAPRISGCRGSNYTILYLVEERCDAPIPDGLPPFDEIWTRGNSLYEQLVPSGRVPVVHARIGAGLSEKLPGRSSEEYAAAWIPGRLRRLFRATDRARARADAPALCEKALCFFAAGLRKLAHRSGAFCGFIRNYLIVRKLRRRLRSKSSGRPLVAVSRIEHLGDIVAVEPILRHLRTRHPDACLVYFIRPQYREIIEQHPCVDEICEVKCVTEWNWLSHTALFDHVYDLHFDDLRCLACNLPLRKKQSFSMVRMDNYFDFGSLLTAFCLTAGLPALEERPVAYIPDEVRRRIDRLMLPEKFVAIHPIPNEKVKEWDTRKWVELYDLLQKETGRLPVVELGLAPLSLDRRPSGWMSLAGKLSILEAAEVIRRAALFVGVDSGPAHLAVAQRTPSVVLLGRLHDFYDHLPYSIDPSLAGNRLRIVRSSYQTSTIPVREVYAACREMLRPPAPSEIFAASHD